MTGHLLGKHIWVMKNGPSLFQGPVPEKSHLHSPGQHLAYAAYVNSTMLNIQPFFLSVDKRATGSVSYVNRVAFVLPPWIQQDYQALSLSFYLKSCQTLPSQQNSCCFISFLAIPPINPKFKIPLFVFLRNITIKPTQLT